MTDCSFSVLYTWNDFPVGTVRKESSPAIQNDHPFLPNWFKRILFVPHT